jgi:hypothetical protein
MCKVKNTVGHAALVHQLADQQEQRHGDQQKRIHGGKHAL